MANEIKTITRIQITNGNFELPITGTEQRVSQTVAGGGVPGMVVLTGTASDIAQTGLTTAGYCFMKNIDDTYNIVYGPDSSGLVEFGLLKPGEEALFRLQAGITFKAKVTTAHTARAIVQIFED